MAVIAIAMLLLAVSVAALAARAAEAQTDGVRRALFRQRAAA
ncbi:hypothetical protein [Sphingomonas sp. IBVSS2]|nr:hypothetical protein [Sphingomonas sp. IBVSS2]